MIESTFQNIIWFPDGAWVQGRTIRGGWYFWDEVGLLGAGPYSSELDAKSAFDKFCEWLNSKPK